MSNTITWKITNMLTMPSENGLSNVVKSIVWNASAASPNTSIPHVTDAGMLELSPPNNQSFISYNSLTEETVLGWLFASDANLKTSVEAKLNQAIANYVAPPPEPTFIPNPWE